MAFRRQRYPERLDVFAKLMRLRTYLDAEEPLDLQHLTLMRAYPGSHRRPTIQYANINENSPSTKVMDAKAVNPPHAMA